MRPRGRPGGPVLGSVLGVLLGTVAAAGESFSPSAACGRCHQEIYGAWKNSMHAHAARDPIFRAALGEGLVERGERLRDLCYRCHAPTWTFGAPPQGEAVQEGVTCDFCHSVSAVRLGDAAKPFEVRPGRVKRGPWKGSKSPAHGTERSPLHTESLFCAGCHEFKSAAGAAVLTTYSEWKAGPYAASSHPCQGCHMPQVEGTVVSPAVAPPTHPSINIHEASGGHSLSQVRKALEVAIVAAERSGDRLHVGVEVTNVASGHRVPTGLPTRRVILRVTGFMGETELFREERAYRKVVADAQGNEIRNDPFLFTDAARVLSDNRIAPKEVRHEAFDLTVPADAAVTLKATLTYVYRPEVFNHEEMNIEMGSASRVVAP